MDEALADSVDEFAEALYRVKDCSQNIIDSYTQPFYGLVKFVRLEPETVWQMFVDLYSDDGEEVKVQMERIKNFFDQNNEFLDRYFLTAIFINRIHIQYHRISFCTIQIIITCIKLHSHSSWQIA